MGNEDEEKETGAGINQILKKKIHSNNKIFSLQNDLFFPAEFKLINLVESLFIFRLIYDERYTKESYLKTIRK